MLLRAGARRGPSARGRRPGRHGHLGDARRARRGERARGHPRRAGHERRRPERRRARAVRRGRPRRPPAREAHRRDASHHRGGRCRGHPGALPPALHRGRAGGGRGRRSRPRHRVSHRVREPGPVGVGAGGRHRAVAAASAHHAGRRSGAGQHPRRPAADRAGERRPRDDGGHRHRRPTVRHVGAQHRPRWRDEQPVVPGGPGAARSGVLGVLVRVGALRLRLLRPVRGMRAGQGRRGHHVVAGGSGGARRGRRQHRGTAPGARPDLRRPGARPGGLRVTQKLAVDLAARPRSLAVVGPFDVDRSFPSVGE